MTISNNYTLNTTNNTRLFNGHTLGEWRNSAAFAMIKADGSVVTWGLGGYGGDSSAVTTQLNGTIDVVQIYSTSNSFAALRSDGSVVTWGTARNSNASNGTDNIVANQLDGTVDVLQIYSTFNSFAALRSDGSVVTWGITFMGGDSSAVADKLNGTIDVTQIFSTTGAFAALRSDGSVVTWGESSLDGGDSSAVATQLDGTIDVVRVYSTGQAFAALRVDGSVVTWGIGGSSTVASQLTNVTQIYSTGAGAFAALRTDGSVATWSSVPLGSIGTNNGGDSSAVAPQLNGTIDVTNIYSTDYAFAALRADGSVVTWGSGDGAMSGGDSSGDSSAVAGQLNGTIDVKQIYSTHGAFAALRTDGSVVTWGQSGSVNGSNGGGDSSAVASQLDGTVDVIQIFSTFTAFAALRADGSVVTWGSNYGGDSSAVVNQLNGDIDVIQIFSTGGAFAALRVDGSIVTWGHDYNAWKDSEYGADSSAVASQLTSDVVSGASIDTNDIFTATRPPTGDPTDILLNGTEDTAYSVTTANLLNGFMDADGDVLSAINLEATHGTVAVTANGWMFTPDADYNGDVILNYAVTDGHGGSLAGTQGFILSAVNDAPVVVNDTLTTKEDTPVIYTAEQLLGNDTDVDGDNLIITSVTSGMGGKAVLNADGTVTFTPNANFNGAANFTYQAKDSALTSNSATVAVAVAAVNDAPALTGSKAILPAGTENTVYLLKATDLLQGFSDVDDDKLSVKNITSAQGTVSDNQNGTWNFTPTTKGIATLNYDVSDNNGGNVAATQSFTLAAGFNIEFRFDSTVTQAYQAVFEIAALRWESIITTDIPDYNGIDDVVIDVSIPYIDGLYKILGQAGPTTLRPNVVSPTYLPLTGIMQFDSADVAYMVSQNIFSPVILHEMGHVLGLGTLWDWDGLKSGGNYIGKSALAVYRDLAGNQTLTSIPLETTGGAGTEGRHWAENVFKTELMTGYVDNVMPLSKMTIGALQDLGYTVDYSKADSYSLPSAVITPPTAPLLSGFFVDNNAPTSGNDVLLGTTGNDSISGLVGNDSLYGLSGVDTLNGGLGNDTYFIENIGDIVIETSMLRTEIDTVNSTVSYMLGTNIENLTLTGTSAINGTGNLLDNVLKGNAAVNNLMGGAGNDTYIVGSGDVVVEEVNGGLDKVSSPVTHTLAANTELLTLTGTAAINGTGNALNNTLTGNVAANILTGGLGNDIYV